MQNQTAIDLNNARRTGSNDTATLENRYNDLTKKIETLDNQKKQADENQQRKISSNFNISCYPKNYYLNPISFGLNSR